MIAFYNDDYAAHGTVSTEKLAAIASKAAKIPGVSVVSHQVKFGKMAKILEGLHRPRYVRAFVSGDQPECEYNGFSWSPDLVKSVLAQNAGQLASVDRLLNSDDKFVFNIAQGFHHAEWARGWGFCTFNGLALVPFMYPMHKVFVLDCDEHGGNGTEDFSKILGNLQNFTIFGTSFGCLGGTNSTLRDVSRVDEMGWGVYQSALEDAFDAIKVYNPDIVIYQAGMDCQIDDPLAYVRLTTEQIVRRDRMVFDFLSGRSTKTLVTMAGGYQGMDSLSSLHAGTFEAAVANL